MIKQKLTDLAEAVRPLSAAEQLAARVAGHAHAQSCCAHTLHIGGANLKSRATCDSTLLPRSPTDVPAPSGQRRCRVHPNHSHKLQAEAIWGLLTSFRSVVSHARASGGGVPDASLLLPAGGVHTICLVLRTCSLQAHQSSRIGRQRPPCAWKSHASICSAFTIRICRIWRELSAHTAGPYQDATNTSYKLEERDLLAPCASLPPYRGTCEVECEG
jgi:hypothetical protein